MVGDKPFSISGVASGAARYIVYSTALSPFGFFPELSWAPSTNYAVVAGIPIVFWNAGGIVFYSDLIDNAEDLIALTSIALVRSAAGRLLLSRAALTISSIIARIPGLVASGGSASNSRAEGQFATAGFFAAVGFL